MTKLDYTLIALQGTLIAVVAAAPWLALAIATEWAVIHLNAVEQMLLGLACALALPLYVPLCMALGDA